MCDQRIFAVVLKEKKLDLSNLPNNRVWQSKEAGGKKLPPPNWLAELRWRGRQQCERFLVWQSSSRGPELEQRGWASARGTIEPRHAALREHRPSVTNPVLECWAAKQGRPLHRLRNGIALGWRMTRSGCRRDVRLLSGVTNTRSCFLGLCSPVAAQSHRLCQQRWAAGSVPALRWSCFHIEKQQQGPWSEQTDRETFV